MNRLLDIFNNMQKPVDRNMNDHVLICDGLNTFIRIFASVPSISENGEHVGGTIGFLKSIGWTIRHLRPTRCIIVFDGVGGSTKRKKIYPEYKNKRINKSSLNRYDEFSDVDSEQESLKKQLNRVSQYLNVLPITTMVIDNVEADDVIAYLTTDICQDKVTIVSTDKDYLQLVNDRVSVYRPTTKELYTPKEIVEEYGVKLENFLLWRLFEGDSSDCIPGIPGIGKKTLIKNFPEITEKIIDCTYLIDESKNKIHTGKKIYSSIVSHSNVLDRNYKLMQLKDVDISADIKTRIRKIYEDAFLMNKTEFKRMWIEDSFQFIIKDVDAWLDSTFRELNALSHR